MVCRQCQQDAKFVGWRPKTITSLMGTVRLSLSYYHCRGCGESRKPWDEQLGLSSQALTPAAAQVVSQAGVLTSFAHASEETLRTMAGLRLSASTVERTTEEAGAQVAVRLADGQTSGPRQAWNWQRDAQGRTCAYVNMDATGVRQQAAGGARADGRMAQVAMVYNPASDHDVRRPPRRQVRFLSGFYELNELGRQLRREAEAVGVMEAEQQIALSDGGAGLEAVLRKFFPRAECILDFWHAKEYLVELAQALYCDDESTRIAWLDQWCHRLKHEGGASVAASLETLDLAGRDAAVRELHRRTLGYFHNHAHRMDYPRYVANGWQIGSGPVQSACKTVVNNRLNGGGMRWGSRGADALCRLRALYLSEPPCWQSLWKPTAPINHLRN